MPFVLEDLVVNRVDLVDEGANSEAFIELYKRKEQSEMNLDEILSKMKPEHADVIKEALSNVEADLNKSKEDLAAVTSERDSALSDLNKANEDLAVAKSELETLKERGECTCDGEADENGMCKVCGKPKKKAKGPAFDETETMKSMPQEIRDIFEKMKMQKEAAEEELRKSKDAEQTAQAVAKAAELKAIPFDHDKLVGIIKSATPDVLDLLTVVNTAIEGTVLGEVGKSNTNGSTTDTDAWTKIEVAAEELAKARSITKEKAISEVIKERPELYKEYLQGGAN